MTTPSAANTAPHIAEQVIPTDEYFLLTTALAAAERPFLAALSCFLSTHPYPPPAQSDTPEPPLVITVTPRPQFPPQLLSQLLPLAVQPPLSAAVSHPHPPYEPLHFHPSHFHSLRQQCMEHGLPLQFPDALVKTTAYLATRSSVRPSVEEISRVLSDSLWPVLLPFQRDAVIEAIRRLRGRVLFADDMGMGKTLQALAVADYYRKVTTNHLASSSPTTLILCPATLRLTWARALTRWLPFASRLSVHIATTPAQLQTLIPSGTVKPRDPWDSVPKVSFVVCSYDLLPRLNADEFRQSLGQNPVFPIVIADECHLLRNFTTARTRSALPWLLAADVRVLISGTPAQSRPADLYPLLYTLLDNNDAPFLRYDHFCNRYCNGTMPTPGSISHSYELNALLSAVMIRRLKSDVKISLPPKRRKHVIVNLSADRLQPLKDLQEEAKSLRDQLWSPHDPNMTAILKSQREAIYVALYTRTADAKI